VESKEFKTQYNLNPKITNGLKRVFPFGGRPKFSPWNLNIQLGVGSHQPQVNQNQLSEQSYGNNVQQSFVQQNQQNINVGVTCCGHLLQGPKRAIQRLSKVGINILGLGHLYGTGSLVANDYPFQYR
jgi:hypothetical protein